MISKQKAVCFRANLQLESVLAFSWIRVRLSNMISLWNTPAPTSAWKNRSLREILSSQATERYMDDEYSYSLKILPFLEDRLVLFTLKKYAIVLNR